MKKKIIIPIIIVVVVGGLIGLRFVGRNRSKFVAVKTSAASQGDINSYLSTTATIKSKNSKDYYPLQGKVKKVNVKVGDTVSKGQVLVEYDITDPNVAVKQAQISYDNAALTKQMQVNSNNDMKNKMADLDKQMADLDNQINEAKKNPLTAANAGPLETQKATLKNTRDSLKVPFTDEQLKQSDNAITLAKINLDSAKDAASKSQSKIVSDIDGVVTAVNVVEGATSMASAQAAVSVQDTNNLKAIVSVGKYDASKIQVGQEAVIKNGDKEYKGKVSFIDPTASKSVSATGSDTTLGVEIDIIDKPEGLKIDFDTDVDILLGQATNVLKVPAESIRTDKDGKTYLFVVENNKVAEKEIKLGLQSDMEAQILEGVKAGDKVILNPSTSIKAGELVKESTGDGK